MKYKIVYKVDLYESYWALYKKHWWFPFWMLLSVSKDRNALCVMLAVLEENK
jgi:hypothetical protein